MSNNGLPFLPGNSFRNYDQTKFPLSQSLSVRNEVGRGLVLETERPTTARLDNLCSTLAERANDKDLSEMPPAWVAFDKVCLRFDAHFSEDIHNRRDESYRVRDCKILFYPEDDSVQVNETKTDNSGMPQGVLIRRCKLPKAGRADMSLLGADIDDDYYTVHDFNVGQDVVLYGRVFTITSCDEFTRNFLQDLGIKVGDPSRPPKTPYADTLRASRAKMDNPGRPYQRVDTLRQFIDYDRKVLRFYLLWDDSEAMFGDRRFLILHYYLANDTIEIIEVMPPNSGRTGNGLLFKRNKLPKDMSQLVKLPGKQADRTVLNVQESPDRRGSRHILDSLRTGEDQDEFYNDSDLQIGTTVDVIGRQMLVCDCDDFTREHYKSKYGIELGAPVDVEEPAAPIPERQVPPPTGYGTEEDSLVSVKKLILAQPKKMAGKFLPKDVDPYGGGYVLRFSAKLTDQSELNKGRPFIIYYFCDDDTVQVFEVGVPNSGITPGKFLQRGRYNKADGSPVRLPDLKIGATINIHRYDFEIDGADDYAINYLKDIGLHE